MDLLLHNGKIVTVDEAFSIHQAVAVRDGRILEVGGNDLLLKYDAGQTIDLEAKALLPGFIDTHIHISGSPVREIDLRETTSIAQLQQQVRAKAEQLGEGEWPSRSFRWDILTGAESSRPCRRRQAGRWDSAPSRWPGGSEAGCGTGE